MVLGVRGKLATVHKTDLLNEQMRQPSAGLEAELARVHAMLAHNSKVYKVLYAPCTFYFLFILFSYTKGFDLRNQCSLWWWFEIGMRMAFTIIARNKSVNSLW